MATAPAPRIHFQPRFLCDCEAHCRRLGHTSMFEADLTRAAKRLDGPSAIALYEQFMEELTEAIVNDEGQGLALHRANTMRRMVFGVDAVPVDLTQYTAPVGGS